MQYLITGGTGFIGKNLCDALLKNGDSVTVLTRNQKKAEKILPRTKCIESLQQLPTSTPFDVMVNLAGQPLASKRWTTRFKKVIVDSRVDTTEKLIQYIRQQTQKPKLFISGSAIGFYGPKGDEKIYEDAKPTPSFTYDLCAKWEAAAKKAEKERVRVCFLRTGLVLGQGGGILDQVSPAYKAGLGGPMGSGKQWMSWIYLIDLIGIILHLVEHPKLKGPINATAPNPVRNQEFASTLAKILHRPAIFKTPAFLLRMAVGEIADELLLTGQRVIPKKVLDSSYVFKFPYLRDALANIYL